MQRIDAEATVEVMLPAWNDGAAKRLILEFVANVTEKGGPEFVPPMERIAVFDNDGTLWAEQPIYFQAFFTLDRVKALAPQHPEWNDKKPFASLLKSDMKAVLAGGERAIIEILMASLAAASSSCARGRSASIASRPSRSSAAASRPSSRCTMASQGSCACLS